MHSELHRTFGDKIKQVALWQNVQNVQTYSHRQKPEINICLMSYMYSVHVIRWLWTDFTLLNIYM